MLSSLCAVFLFLQFSIGTVIYHYLYQKVTSEYTLNLSGTQIHRFIIVHTETGERWKNGTSMIMWEMVKIFVLQFCED